MVNQSFLHCTKETFPVRLYVSNWGCLRKVKTLYRPILAPCVFPMIMFITSGSTIHLKRFGSDIRSTTFDFAQRLSLGDFSEKTHKLEFKVIKHWARPSGQQRQLTNFLMFGSPNKRLNAGICHSCFKTPFSNSFNVQKQHPVSKH